MADAIVSVALEKLNHVVGQQLALFAGANRELKRLSSTFQSIRAVLADAESRQVEEKAVHLWLSRLRQVAHDIHDLLEECVVKDGSSNDDDDDSEDRVCATACLPTLYTFLDRTVSRYKLARGIQEIRERLDDIADEKNKYSLIISGQGGGDDRTLVRSQCLTTSLMDESEIFIGRENDKETMISKLVRGSSHEDRRQVQVVAIVGIGGLGKTTLARQVYHDGMVQDHFNKAVYWVCVSDAFDVIRLTKAILEQVKGTNIYPSEPDALQKELLQALGGKSFLLVLDDVWNDDAEKWNMLRLPLNSGAQGSRILVTSRSEKVANAMNANFTHELKRLSDDQSWQLFSSRASAGRKMEEYLELENVGREILNKYKGVLLWIKVIGSEECIRYQNMVFSTSHE